MPTNRTRRRLANKTIWALEDIIACCRRGRRALDDARRRASEVMDPLLLKALLAVSEELAHITTLALEARQGDYHQ